MKLMKLINLFAHIIATKKALLPRRTKADVPCYKASSPRLYTDRLEDILMATGRSPEDLGNADQSYNTNILNNNMILYPDSCNHQPYTICSDDPYLPEDLVCASDPSLACLSLAEVRHSPSVQP